MWFQQLKPKPMMVTITEKNVISTSRNMGILILNLLYGHGSLRRVEIYFLSFLSLSRLLEFSLRDRVMFWRIWAPKPHCLSRTPVQCFSVIFDNCGETLSLSDSSASVK